jgi:hypothetical protein
MAEMYQLTIGVISIILLLPGSMFMLVSKAALKPVVNNFIYAKDGE